MAEKKWEDMTWQEKREKRFEKWLNPPIEFNNAEAEKRYKERVNRFIKVIKLEEPDRVPCMLPAGFAAHHYGVDLKTMMYDYEASRRLSLKILEDFEMDIFSGAGGMPGRVLETLDDRSFSWPGHGLPDDAMLTQFNEREYMKADEYDALINDPSDFMLRYYVPRATGALEGFAKLPPFYSCVRGVMGVVGAMLNPEIRKGFQTLLDVSEEFATWGRTMGEVGRAAMAAGVPSLGLGGAGAPFDSIADGLRGTRGVAMDMFRQPDKLIEAMERILPIEIQIAIDGGNQSLCPVIMIPLHKGDDTFMSDEQFERFYWPTFRKLLVAMVEEGLVPCPFAEGRFNNRLKTIKNLPRSGVMWYFDQTDMYEAKKVLGDVSCIVGNVPSSLLITGTPEAVKENCRQLIEGCAPGGGYVLAGGAGIHKGDPENVRAMMAAAKEYGVYGGA